jgi:hypothetical protein
MSRALRFAPSVVIHLVIAVIGTAILDAGLRRTLATPPSVSRFFWNECLLSIVSAMGIGFSVWRVWRNSAANYTWVPAAAWFAVGLVATLGQNNVFGRLFPFGPGGNFGPAEIRSFFAFTVPLIRAISYSLGAYLSSIFRAAPLPRGSE